MRGSVITILFFWRRVLSTGGGVFHLEGTIFWRRVLPTGGAVCFIWEGTIFSRVSISTGEGSAFQYEGQCCQIVNKVQKFMNLPPFAKIVYELQSIYELSMNINFCELFCEPF